jgi:colanic acid/amylovoran biosynthesis protein
MRILVDPGNYDLRNGNLGCLAVLQVGLERLRDAFAPAVIQALTTNPAALASRFPWVEPVPIDLGWEWYSGSRLLGRVQGRLPEPLARRAVRARLEARMRHPQALAAWLAFKQGRTRPESAAFGRLQAAFDAADLVAVTGLGGLRSIEVHVLRSLQAAVGRGIPTAMLGLGLSGEHAPGLLAAMTTVLPRLSLLAVREGRTAPALLARLGVDPSRVMITGDDAVALAYRARPAIPGGALGVNLRVMDSAGIAPDFVPRLRPVLQRLSAQFGCGVIPLPGAHGIAHPDSMSLRELMAGWVRDCDGGAMLQAPAEVIAQVGQCRLVVTGAYHIAVFALAQGIPAVCFAGSPYFQDKLLGLAGMFGDGCDVIDVHRAGWETTLQLAVERRWRDASALRVPLLDAARRQCMAGEDALRRLQLIVGTGPHRRAG